MARPRALDYMEKRDFILQKSAQLFAQYGYTGTSITMISKFCGVSKALLYHYYSDKEAVLFDILHAHLTNLVTQVESVSAETSAGEAQLLAIGERLLDIYRDSHAEHQVQLANLALLPENKRAVMHELERKLVTAVATAIAVAVPSVAQTPALKPLTMSWFGMINWHYLWFREEGGISRTDYARMACRLITTGGAAAGRLT